MVAPFLNRTDAGRKLAKALSHYSGRKDVLLLALPRGGVPVAFEIARELKAPLDVFLVRKLGVPGHEELAMGAIASGGIRVLNDDVILSAGISDTVIERVALREQKELERGERAYRGERPITEPAGRVAVLVDDGVATGASMRAAVTALRAKQPSRIVVAVPTAPPGACEAFESEADETVCLVQPYPFFAVGGSYEDFSEISDEEVRRLLDDATRPSPSE